MHNCPNKPNYDKVDDDADIYRRRKGDESAEKLEAESKKAEANDFPRGVSGSKKDFKNSPDVEVARAGDLRDKDFPVGQTGKNKSHVTIETPNPITPKALDDFNKCFKKRC